MSPMGTRHASIVDRLIQLLYQKLGQKTILRVQNPLRLNNNSQPEPDLSLLIPRSDFYVAAHPCPQDIYLIIEVSDSTFDYDRYTEISLYAEANIEEVWIVNREEECLEVYRHPLHDSYQAIQKYYRGESIFIESFPEIELTLMAIIRVRGCVATQVRHLEAPYQNHTCSLSGSSLAIFKYSASFCLNSFLFLGSCRSSKLYFAQI